MAAKWDNSVDCQMCRDAYGKYGCDLCPSFCLQIFEAKQKQMEAEAEELKREAERLLEEEAIKQSKTKEEIHKDVGGGTQMQHSI